MVCFSARVRFYKALLGLEIFDGRREFFGGGGAGKQGFAAWLWLKPLSQASQLPHLIGGGFETGSWPQERFLAAAKIRVYILFK